MKETKKLAALIDVLREFINRSKKQHPFARKIFQHLIQQTNSKQTDKFLQLLVGEKALDSEWTYEPINRQKLRSLSVSQSIVYAGDKMTGVAQDKKDYDQAHSTFITVYKFICNPKARVTHIIYVLLLIIIYYTVSTKTHKKNHTKI